MGIQSLLDKYLKMYVRKLFKTEISAGVEARKTFF